MTFDGSLKGPTKAEMWITFMEIIFHNMRCPNNQKAQCDVSQITWKQFNENFYAKFFSTNLKDTKHPEFLDLKQG
ncbi:gag protease polyprotein [Cucumis melo var. makuwa]|uniref:Gag protease polyprotein n=1 Tax=Cucumis melo var. makuwa TaxID=1194695 RepID=A0A5A7TSW9_CUCMM|nr:gag protease polyprotein [Cucumis melo var. makuwa]